MAASATVDTVTLAKDLARSLRRGHPWVYRDAVRAPAAPIDSGRLVVVRDRGRDGRALAWGFWDARSPIAVRVVDQAPVADPEALVRRRLAEALAARRARLDPAATNAFRWVHG